MRSVPAPTRDVGIRVRNRCSGRPPFLGPLGPTKGPNLCLSCRARPTCRCFADRIAQALRRLLWTVIPATDSVSSGTVSWRKIYQVPRSVLERASMSIAKRVFDLINFWGLLYWRVRRKIVHGVWWRRHPVFEIAFSCLGAASRLYTLKKACSGYYLSGNNCTIQFLLPC